MGDLFTLPPDIDDQVSPLYQKKVRGRQAAKQNYEISNLDSWASSPEVPVAPQATSATPKEKRGLVKDTALGVVGGARDGIQEMADSLLSMRNWVARQMDQKLGTQYGQKEYTHELAPVAENERLPGQLTRGITQFVSGFIPGAGTVSKVQKGAKALGMVPKFLQNSPKMAMAIKGAAAGAFADATAFDPHQNRLSNLVQEAPMLANPISEYLAAKPEDSEAEGRFKNALEGVVIGTALEGLLYGLKYMKANKSVKPGVKDSFEEALNAADEAVGVKPTDPIGAKIHEQQLLEYKIDNASNAARGEEQRLLEWTGGRADDVAYGDGFVMRDPITERGFTTDTIVPLRPAERIRLQLEHNPSKQIEYKPNFEMQGKPKETPLEQIIRDTEPQAGQLGDAIPGSKALGAADEISAYVKALGHKSVDTFLDGIRNTKGFATGEVLQGVAGGGVGGLVGGKVDIDGDGKITITDVAAGFVLGASLAVGGKKVVQKLTEGKTEKQAIKELSAEKVAQLDTVIAKVKGAMNSGTLDEKQLANLQTHLDTLEKFKGHVKKVDAGVISKSIKDGEVKAGYKDSLKPLVSFKENPSKLTSLQDAIMSGEKAQIDEVLDVNFKYVNDEESIENIIRLTSEKMGTPKDAVRSEAMVKEIADELGYTTKTLETLRKAEGDTKNLDSRLYAIRGLLLKSAGEVEAKATAALANPMDAMAQLELRRQLTIHTGIQRSLSKTRTEVGRALRSFQIMSEPMANLKELEAMVAGLGGAEKNGKVAQHVLDLIKNGDKRGMNQYARAIDANPKLNAVMEYFINSLLSAPSTHMVNITSNLLSTIMMPSERLMAGVISAAKGGDSRQFKQARAMMVGLQEGINDAWRMCIESWKREEAILDPLTKIEGVHYKSIASDALDIDKESIIGRAVDWLGTIVRVPGRTLTASDEFFKVINFRMALNEQIYMKAVTDLELKGLQGEELAKATAELITQMKNDVPESIMEVIPKLDSDMKDAALQMARYNTFTQNLNPGLQGVQKAINAYPLVKFIVPFFKVPVNILKYAHERTPLINLMSKEFRANLTSADPAVRELAQARTAMGAMAYTTGFSLASMGIISGRTTEIGKGLKDTSAHDIAGVPSYSIKLGDKWYGFNRLDPLGMMLGISADVANLIGKVDEADADDIAVASIAAIANNITSKTYLQGIANLMDVVNNPSDFKIQRFINSFLSTAVPNAAYAAVKGIDPVAREAHDFIDYLYRKTPGLSSELPPVRNIFGEPVTLKPGYGMDTMSPVYTSKESDDPVKQEFMRLGISSSNHISSMRKLPGMKDRLSPEQFDRFMVLMGEPLKKSLDRLIASPRYQQLSETLANDLPGGKAQAIQHEITKHKQQAKARLLREFPELRQELLYNRRLKKEAGKNQSGWLQQQLE